MANQRINHVAMTAFDTSGLAASYKVINNSGLPGACFLLHIINASNVPVNISFNGATDHEYLASGGRLELGGVQSMQEDGVIGAYKKGTKVYVSGPNPGAGYIYLSGSYLED